MKAILLPLLAATALAGCMTAQQHSTDVNAAAAADSKVTVGTVQREIRKGMTGGEVAGVLGSPNVVTSNPGGGETWIYDKISTTSAYSRSASGASILVLGGGQAAGAASTTQRTLTVIIVYGADGRVSDYSYRQSSF